MKKALAIGCGTLLVLLGVAVYGWIMLGGYAWDWLKGEYVAEQTRQQLIADWQPPADPSPLRLFPVQVAGVGRASMSTAALPEFSLNAPAPHAVYTKAGQPLEVFAYRLTALEKDVLFERIEQVYDDHSGPGQRTLLQTDYRCYYAYQPPVRQYHIWWLHGWLFVFRAADDSDWEPFVLDYLRAVGRPVQLVGR